MNGLLRGLAPLIASTPFILGIVGLLFIWAVWSGLSLLTSSRKLARRLRKATSLLGPSPEPESFSRIYEEVSVQLEEDPLLGRPWRGYRHSLITPERDGEPVVATADPGSWFSLPALFRDAKADLRYHAAVPGLLVGAGLLVTFLGLAAALASAGDVVQSGADHARNAALHDLLGAASAKFVTSLAGLFFSIAYALHRKACLRLVEGTFDSFLSNLRLRIPFRTTAYMQAHANTLLERQYNELQQIGNEFFVRLGDTLGMQLDSGLGRHIEPMAAAIDRLAQGISNQNEEALGSMLGSFMERLEGAVGESMRGTAATLERLGERLDGLQSGLDGAAQRMSKASEDMAAGLGRGMEAVLGDMATQMSELVAGLRQAAEEVARNNRSASDDASQKMKEAASGLVLAVTSFRQHLEEGAASSVSQLAAPIEGLLSQLRLMTEMQREAGSEASQALAETIGRAASSLEATASRVADALDGGAADASQRLVVASEAMRDDLRAVLERFSATLSESGTTMVESADRGGKALARAVAAMGDDLSTTALRLREAGEAAGDALKQGGAEARVGMVEAARLLISGSDGLGGKLSGLNEAAGSLAGQISVLSATAGAVTGPLDRSAVDLKLAAEAARAAAAPLTQTGEAIKGSMNELARLSVAFEGSQRQAGDLTTRLTGALDRFEGLDSSIARTLTSLGEGVQELKRSMTQYVTEVDGGLAKSVSRLTSGTENLEETISDLVDELKSLGRSATFAGSVP